MKGIGGFYLTCDASNAHAVNEPCRRKGQADKPFAIMAADLETIQVLCNVHETERDFLTGREKPIVLLTRKTLKGYDRSGVCDQVAPKLDTLGLMLPYTPLHHLLLNQTDPVLMKEPAPVVLVMTSGNFSEESLVSDNLQALQKPLPLAEAFLLHNQDIYTGCDESLVCVTGQRYRAASQPPSDIQSRPVFLRRSRGFAPYCVPLPFMAKPTLALGSPINNTFCLARDGSAFLSQHLGDMDSAEITESFEQSVTQLSHIFRIQPEILARDPDPNSFTTQYARRSRRDVPEVEVQHHHAHIAACMADNGLEDRHVIGLSFDGSGYGSDGAIWGREVLLASYADFERLAHLEYLPLPGGNADLRHPWRIAVSYAHALEIEIDDLPFLETADKQAINIVKQQVDGNFNVACTSSMGRLFDAVASLIGVRNDVSYQAQAAIEMEVLARPFVSMVKSYPYFIEESSCGLIIRLNGLLGALVKGLRSHEPPEMVAARFHRTLADMAVGVCKYARIKTALNEVALSGSVWQNQILLNLVRVGLANEGFVVYFHKQVPANNGGLALGQAVVANHVIVRGERS